MRAVFLGGALMAAALSGPALAHHSYSMFDGEKTLVIPVTIRDLQWSNPHIWLEVTAPAGVNGGDWSFEGGSIALLKRNGWSREMLKAGDKIVVTVHPLRNGTKGGSLVKVTLANGTELFGGTRTATPTRPDLIER